MSNALALGRDEARHTTGMRPSMANFSSSIGQNASVLAVIFFSWNISIILQKLYFLRAVLQFLGRPTTITTPQLFVSRFYKRLEVALETAASANNSPAEEAARSHPVYVHRRKRRTAQEQDVRSSPGGRSEELGPEDDAENSLDIFAELMM